MASKVAICNRALVRLGDSTIASLTDGTVQAKRCNVLFDQAADSVMAEGWTSNTRRSALNITTNTPEFGYTTEYQLPTNPFCLKVLSINDTVPGEFDYRIEGDKLLANTSGIEVRYAARITDTQSYNTYLTDAIVWKLIAELTYPTTNSITLSEAAERRYDSQLRRLLSLDGQQGSSEEIGSNDLLDVR